MAGARGYLRAAHAAPTAAVTVVMTAFAWRLGWTGGPLAVVGLAILVGQLSVGWSNDAFDARTDATAGRDEKPTVADGISPGSLWAAASVALVVASGLSWGVAGLLGGSFHVAALLVAWLYNVALSRTIWSWLPYALAFGAMPLFLSYGLDGRPPPAWTVAVFAVIAVSAHLANALPDIESDRAVGRDGLAIRLGPRRTIALCWVLLATGTVILAAATRQAGPWTGIVLVAAYALALTAGTLGRHRSSMFRALLVAVLIDVLAVIASPAL
jgi:4-hydroxybenzoate polyprenyltransferase